MLWDVGYTLKHSTTSRACACDSQIMIMRTQMPNMAKAEYLYEDGVCVVCSFLYLLRQCVHSSL